VRRLVGALSFAWSTKKAAMAEFGVRRLVGALSFAWSTKKAATSRRTPNLSPAEAGNDIFGEPLLRWG
jgi:hypothetical protein